MYFSVVYYSAMNIFMSSICYGDILSNDVCTQALLALTMCIKVEEKSKHKYVLVPLLLCLLAFSTAGTPASPFNCTQLYLYYMYSMQLKYFTAEAPMSNKRPHSCQKVLCRVNYTWN